jgi:hypothetical protein
MTRSSGSSKAYRSNHRNGDVYCRSGIRADQLKSLAGGEIMANLMGAEVPDPQLESLTLPEPREFVARSTWTFAKTMPKTPPSTPCGKMRLTKRCSSVS